MNLRVTFKNYLKRSSQEAIMTIRYNSFHWKQIHFPSEKSQNNTESSNNSE